MLKMLGDVAHVDPESLGNKTPPDYSFDYVSISDVVTGKVVLDQVGRIKFSESPSRARRVVRKGDTLFSTVRPNLKAVAHIGYDVKDFVASTGFAVIRPKDGVSGEYLYHYLLSRHVDKQIEALVSGSNYPAINSSDVRKISMFIPELAEQQRIAACLSTWDRAIELHDKLIALKEKQKQGLMQVLLTGKKRLLDDNGVPFSGEWQARKISDFIVESKIAGSNGSIAKKITVKLYGNGVFAKNESRAGSESTRYFKRRAGQFIYSKLDFLNGAFGIIPSSLDGFESTADLPAFDFKDSVDGRWFLSLISRDIFYKSQLDLASGGRKARRVNPPDFLAITIQAPSVSEQTKIADILCMADKEIAALKSKRDLLNQQKQGLMQQLLG